MRFTSQRFYNFYDVEMLRTLIDATPASDAGIQSFMLGRIIDELMHKSLAIPLQLRRTAVCRRHLRKVGIHAGIPAAVTYDLVIVRLEFADVETLAGRTHERTRAAGKAGFGKFLPFGAVENIHRFRIFEVRKIEV